MDPWLTIALTGNPIAVVATYDEACAGSMCVSGGGAASSTVDVYEVIGRSEGFTRLRVTSAAPRDACSEPRPHDPISWSIPPDRATWQLALTVPESSLAPLVAERWTRDGLSLSPGLPLRRVDGGYAWQAGDYHGIVPTDGPPTDVVVRPSPSRSSKSGTALLSNGPIHASADTASPVVAHLDLANSEPNILEGRVRVVQRTGAWTQVRAHTTMAQVEGWVPNERVSDHPRLVGWVGCRGGFIACGGDGNPTLHLPPGTDLRDAPDGAIVGELLSPWPVARPPRIPSASWIPVPLYTRWGTLALLADHQGFGPAASSFVALADHDILLVHGPGGCPAWSIHRWADQDWSTTLRCLTSNTEATLVFSHHAAFLHTTDEALDDLYISRSALAAATSGEGWTVTGKTSKALDPRWPLTTSVVTTWTLHAVDCPRRRCSPRWIRRQWAAQRQLERPVSDN